ncbi:hypothetical protein DdX_11659 [Ditylenchus destructor]|uniref:Uncharacterized protein n=1 Tax=Ditylenchus destructor TaxID=166010 RepID=A0AAD4MYK4_9BILA|nr:hypothetical protein DdX_11659 [Ditylenchus destructor]
MISINFNKQHSANGENKAFPKSVIYSLLCLMTQTALTSGIAEGGKDIPIASTSQCILEEAEKCFDKLFQQMPICPDPASSSEHLPLNTEQNGKLPPLSFRCQHFNVLDTCFRDSSIVCLPAAIGHTAKVSYRKKINECARLGRRHVSPVREHYPRKNYRSAQGRRRQTSLRSHSNPLTELQFISLFGYLQTQCRRTPAASPQLDKVEAGSVLNFADHRTSAASSSTQGIIVSNNQSAKDNCTTVEFVEVMENCEMELRQRSAPKYSELDRHQLLRMKLDVSSKLLYYPETNRDEECLIVRSSLAEIFLIHQKYCFETTATRCLCERLRFEEFCAIECINLEPHGLAFDQRLTWKDFRGRLVGDHANRMTQAFAVWILCLILLFVRLPY